ncbi:DUF2357 domain-containing protein [Actinoplanes flavus]|uniref:DUF2357 domain-containing protein n=1 Tax=Actinoplanes flavus TaxID=2820290 RepID=A0ABS3UX99_9ACTN|nr:DUF2357 domain-containing protein [Actinoplanes flavus]MBO3743210.1 DUF2357 domain-containing protein [Actinoplanes flavus]
MEGQRYRYELQGFDRIVQLEPAEIFDADDETMRSGRILPGQYVGKITVVVRFDGSTPLSTTVEVVPAKLTQAHEYRQMLADITAHAAEAVLQGFAPATVEAVVTTRNTDLLYQQFAVLESQVRSDEFGAAVGRILGNPHVDWRSATERRRPGGAHPAGSHFGRALAAPGPRQPWLPGRGRAALATMPTTLERQKHESTTDTAPNRFIKHVLETWRAIAQQLLTGLVRDDGGTPQPGPARRGVQAAEEVIEILDEILSHPFFRHVGILDRFPASSQVLLKREGYRQLLHMSVLVLAGLDLSFESGIEDIYRPSLRNVATLYELWCYLALVDIVGMVCEQPQSGSAFTLSKNGLSLRLKTGEDSAVRWQTMRRGRSLEVQLLFNRQFNAGGGSWTASMRPDCSVLIRPLDSTLGGAGEPFDVWLHFDAKYRVSGASSIELWEENGESSSRGAAKNDDLLKMHAYRDAIHRTAGAYVLYPGDKTFDKRQFAETLPGLGAFPLRPGATERHGVEAISNFLAEVLDHVADQATQHERERFWRSRIHASPVHAHPNLSPVPFLDKPPADTDVLVGYVRGSQHRAWIDQARSYNVRADSRSGSVRLGSRVLSATMVLLYELADGTERIVGLARAGEWRAVDRQELIDTGYPAPRGNLYLVTSLEVVSRPPDWLPLVRVSSLRPPGHVPGAPFAVTWLDLMSSTLRT